MLKLVIPLMLLWPVTAEFNKEFIRTQVLLEGDLHDVPSQGVKCVLDQCALGVWESIFEVSSGSVRRKLLRKSLHGEASLHKCRHSIESAYYCLKAALESILEGKSKCHCAEDAVGWAVRTVEYGKAALLEEYCNPEEQCMDPRANECVDTVDFVFDALANLEKSENRKRSEAYVNIGELLMKMEKSEKCLHKIRKGDILLHGCENKAYLKDAELLYGLTAARATLVGCDVKTVSTSCGLSKVLEGSAEFCALEYEEASRAAVKIVACSTMEFLRLGHSCSEVIQNLLVSCGALLKSTRKYCSLHKKAFAHIAACQGNPSSPDESMADASGTVSSQQEVSGSSEDSQTDSNAPSRRTNLGRKDAQKSPKAAYEHRAGNVIKSVMQKDGKDTDLENDIENLHTSKDLQGDYIGNPLTSKDLQDSDFWSWSWVCGMLPVCSKADKRAKYTAQDNYNGNLLTSKELKGDSDLLSWMCTYFYICTGAKKRAESNQEKKVELEGDFENLTSKNLQEDSNLWDWLCYQLSICTKAEKRLKPKIQEISGDNENLISKEVQGDAAFWGWMCENWSICF